ncbi:AAA family ATPase [Klebsiella pneumoniae]|uniref:AAA family ATPase n=2 Tax=Klebsiella pneumoniae TaxID=573 RepID=UPI0007D0C4F6|nr:AAA family ATPase [Klebsiella pneumoniae]MBC5160796.1 AAA family ATPase [Klebsiella pneumoniae]MBK2699629.1 AAA family ATPase [Klebsiella pneumoniae]MBK2725656.1 AAA family ATPase [Klebsiella pneumoniae]MCJ7359521.1 AAA family ATPase [Klebsiella pneumoniae]NBZ12611.1 AAA family ATPase [Klebsiella pneumoniae]
MKFEIKNIGLIDDATIEIADITCICGLNNTGKTYVTYAIYGFLAMFKELSHKVLTQRVMQTKPKDGLIDLDDIFKGGTDSILKDMSSIYVHYLSDVFGTKNLIKENSQFRAYMPNQDIDYLSCEMQRLVTPKSKNQDGSINILKTPGSKYIEFIADASIIESFEIRRFAPFIVTFLHREVLEKITPKVYIASAERTGAAIFRDELDFAKLRLFDILKNKQDKKDISDALMNEAFGGNYSYAWPIEHNVDFVRKIETMYKDSGYFYEKHPEIIADFENIIGGSYKVIKNVLVYQSNSSGKQKFAMSEASSSVRALLDIGFYIRCKLSPGDLLMIDEPELNLHPRNQRMLARLLAKLVNHGVKVFLTTHSDFIIKEMNILIMLNNSKKNKIVAEKYKYSESEFLSSEQVSIYVTSKEKQSRKWINTLTKATITKEFGVSLPTFDNSIEEMIDIQSELYFGE